MNDYDQIKTILNHYTNKGDAPVKANLCSDHSTGLPFKSMTNSIKDACDIEGCRNRATGYFTLDDVGVADYTSQKRIELIEKLMVESGLEITECIDAVISLNGYIGVGLISLGERLDKYCQDQIRLI